jgi:hypothetical protein
MSDDEFCEKLMSHERVTVTTLIDRIEKVVVWIILVMVIL